MKALIYSIKLMRKHQFLHAKYFTKQTMSTFSKFLTFQVFRNKLITVYDLTGKQVLTQKTTANALDLDIASLPKGTYLVQVKCNNITYTEKIMRQ